jgi:hypothetical protein
MKKPAIYAGLMMLKIGGAGRSRTPYHIENKGNPLESTSASDQNLNIRRALAQISTKKGFWELLQVPCTVILRRAKRGSIPSFRVGSCVRFDSAAIAKWLMQQGVRSMSKG